MKICRVPVQVFLSFTHFVATYIGCICLLHMGFFQYKVSQYRA